MTAQELLERTDHGIEQIAADCGLAPMMLRRHFTRRWGVTPVNSSGMRRGASGPRIVADAARRRLAA
jgi:transcriptional regulator GlxA family with amidase domain